jgi:cyclohexadieny/prephenate dehydrogenase
MAETLFQCAAIIGLGQMGASLGLAMRAGGMVAQIVGIDNNAVNAEKALKMGAVDRIGASLTATVKDADLIILCTPVGSYESIMQQIAPTLQQNATLTDIGSIKAQAIRDIMPHLPPYVRLVPSHPIAGSEKTGPDYARADFFARKLFLITPLEGTPPEWVEPIAKLWHSTGAAVDLCPPELHDHIYAYMSHLPQLIAYGAMLVLASQPVSVRDEHTLQEQLFARFIRIGRSDPRMWRDVFLENAHFTLAAAGNVQAILEHMRDELLLGGNRSEDPLSVPVERICKSLWPRMLGSAMIAAVNIAEEQMQMKLARYAAGGFTDVSCPVMESTDDDFAAISEHPSYAIKLLSDYIAAHKKLTDAIASQDAALLLELLTQAQAAGFHVAAQLEGSAA